MTFDPWLPAMPARYRATPKLFRLNVKLPIPAIRSVKVPMLFIYGGADPWVPVAQSITQLEKISKQQHNIRYAVIAEASHEMMFQARETMEFGVSEYAPQAPAYFMAFASWLSRQVGN